MIYSFFYVIYYLLLLFLLIFFKEKKSYNKIIIIIFIGIYSLLVCLRPDTTPDTESYRNIYEIVNFKFLDNISLFEKNINLNVEYGYIIWMLLCKSIGLRFKEFLFLTSYSVILIMIKSCKMLCEKYKIEFNPTMCLFLTTIIFGFYYINIAIRAGIAMSLAFLCFGYFINKKYLLSVISITIAFSIQRMALLGVVSIIIFLFSFKISKKVLYKIWILLGIIIFITFYISFPLDIINLLENIVGSIGLGYEYYFESNLLERGITFIRILYWLVGGIILYNYDENRGYYKIILIYFISLFLYGLLSNFVGVNRIVNYFTIYCIPIVFANIKKGYILKKKNVIFFNFNLVNILLITILFLYVGLKSMLLI